MVLKNVLITSVLTTFKNVLSGIRDMAHSRKETAYRAGTEICPSFDLTHRTDKGILK